MTKDLTEALLAHLARKDYVPLAAPELLRALRLPPARRTDLDRCLRQLEHTGRVARLKGHRYIRPLEADLVPGRIRLNRQGRGFLQPDDPGLREIAVPESATGTALHEDRVLVRRDVRPQGLRPEAPAPDTGTVVRVLERRRTQIVGTLQRSRQFLYVVPDDPRLPHDVYVPPPRDVGRTARPGDKVVVALSEWTSRHTNPEGEIVEVLGPPDAEGVDMLAVLRHYDLPLHFPRPVLQEARACGTAIAARDLKGRLDCRAQRVVTIDPDDARDFDDAFCLERVAGSDTWRLWVHIADVSHYVRPGGPLDVEARRRGNSTYLVDRVIPMLPEALSNELCSLQPGVDRLTKCVEFHLGADGRVLAERFHSAVIHSHRRFTYAEAFAVLQRAPSQDPIEQMLHQAHQVAQRLRRARFRNGALALDFPERKIRLDDQGRIARIERVENDVSHQLIEEFMLLANEAVATRLKGLGRAALYRVHEEPEARRLQEYREEVLSHNVPCGPLRQRSEVQRLLQRLDTSPLGPALKIGFLKSLMRARYAAQPLGHYGLAKRDYTHFTSPIRRYADLVVHRAMFGNGAATALALEETADHLSLTERNSADAERDSKDTKLFAYLNAQLKSGRPQRYPALVTDARNFGFFVEVSDLTLSGLVPLSMATDDFYEFDAARHQLVGRRTRRVIRLGDRVTVQVARVDTFKKQVDFRLADGSSPRGVSRPRRRGDDRGVARGSQRRPERSAKAASPPASSPTRRGGFKRTERARPAKGAPHGQRRRRR
ncbi:MAG: ribonuclease R [Verrucomicrobiales bacterium]|nr:ribonuclease R [Verrucomicrobiales bacterium]